jgi:TolB-like protein/cytochrome c-type biogenesis protein CcmH/NrfG
MPFIEELKRRNVFRVGIAYLVLSWMVVQAADVAFPILQFPNWTISFVAVLAILGFPLVLFLAWAFELTPEGIKREHEVDRSQSVAHITGRKRDFAIIGLLVVALGYFAYDKFFLVPARDAARVDATTEAVNSEAIEQAVQAPDNDKSIAVLPFVNMSDDVNNEYFSDGISEELLNLLSRVPKLRVIARTSSFSYKGKDATIADIARELNVDHVLEGSVRKSGDQVRITAQLIRANDSSHLWSESYDRTLDNIFAIQDEIAAAVVEQLKVTLLGAVLTVRETDPAAYALFLQARFMAHQGTPEAWEQSLALYQQALEIDPDYAASWVGLAEVNKYQSGVGQSPKESIASAREAANRALEIDPAYAPGHAVLGRIALDDGDLRAAARHFERALVLEPSNLHIFWEAGILARSLGRMEESLAITKYAVARDPVNLRGLYLLGLAYFYAGQLDEAIASLRTVLRLRPGYVVVQTAIGAALQQKGEFDAALVAVQAESHEGWRLVGLANTYHALGQKAESDAALAELIEKFDQQLTIGIAIVLARRGEADRAFDWLDKAVQYKDPILRFTVPTNLFAALHDDPRWLPFLESIDMSPTQLAAIEFNVTLPE